MIYPISSGSAQISRWCPPEPSEPSDPPCETRHNQYLNSLELLDSFVTNYRTGGMCVSLMASAALFILTEMPADTQDMS